MKKSIKIGFLLLFVNFQCVFAQENFFKIYSSTVDVLNASIVSVEGEKAIVCGSENNNKQVGRIAKIDKFGEIEKMLVDSTITSYQYIVKNENDANIMVSGYKDTVVNGITTTLRFVFQKINTNLDILQTWKINIPNYNITSSMGNFVIVQDSLLFFVNYVKVPNLGVQLLYSGIYKYNLNSLEQTSREVTYNGMYYMLRDIIHIKNKNQIKLNLSPTQPYIVANYDYDLNLISNNILESELLYIGRLDSYTDSSYFHIAATSRYGNNKARHLGVGTYNFEDVLEKQVVIESGRDTLHYPSGRKHALVTSDCIWVAGAYNVDIVVDFPCVSKPTWVSLNKLNHNLELLEQFFYGGNGVYVPSGIVKTENDNIIVAGTFYNNDNAPFECHAELFVLKVNKEGVIVSTKEKQLQHEAIVFPNPGNDYLQVKLAVQHKRANIQLFDINGKNVLSEEITSDMQQVNTTALVKGSYVYRIIANQKIIGTGKWIKN